MTLHYLKAPGTIRNPAGFVLDMDTARGGNPQEYLDRGWVEIDKSEFDVLLKAQYARQAADRAAWIKEIEDGDAELPAAFAEVAARFEAAPRSVTTGG